MCVQAAVPHGDDLAVLVYVSDDDPDQDQVGLAEDAISEQQQQHEQVDSVQQLNDTTTAEDSAAIQTDSEPIPTVSNSSRLPSTAPVAAVSDPVAIPQPVKRPSRAANAIVRSPSGPSVLEQAAAAAVASATNAVTGTVRRVGSGADVTAGTDASAAGESEATSSRVSADNSTAAGDGSLAASSSPSKSTSRRASLKASHRAAGAGESSVPASPSGGKPPLPAGSSSSSSTWSRATSMVSRASDTSAGAAAEILPEGMAHS